jgi:hypothetical protein
MHLGEPRVQKQPAYLAKNKRLLNFAEAVIECLAVLKHIGFLLGKSLAAFIFLFDYDIINLLKLTTPTLIHTD